MKKIYVFEGPDGCGKSTLARIVAEKLGATYYHHGPYPEVVLGSDLVSAYMRTMTPAFCGDSDVVLDRCWVSEVPYGLAFRSGADRLGDWRREYLENEMIAADWRVYVCLPPYERALENFRASQGTQYLETADQFRRVYDWYGDWARSSGWRNLVRAIDPFSRDDWAEEICR